MIKLQDHLNRCRKKEKHFHDLYSFMINFFQPAQKYTLCMKTLDSIMFSGENLKVFSLGSEKRQGCLLPSLLLILVLEILARGWRCDPVDETTLCDTSTPYGLLSESQLLHLLSQLPDEALRKATKITQMLGTLPPL